MIDVVWSWLVRLEVPEQDRDDILQEVFYQALRSFHTYDPTRSRPVRWLNKIAVHLAGHYRERAYHRREQLCPELPPFAELDPRPLVPELIEAEQDRRLLYDLLQAIEPELRSVLVAHDIDEIPMAEIAEQRGIPLSTAYKWRARALEGIEESYRYRESMVEMVPWCPHRNPSLRAPPAAARPGYWLSDAAPRR